MNAIEQLLAMSRAYAAAEQVSFSIVSWRLFGDSKKIAAIEAGADLQTRRWERAVQWFSDNWPEGAVWPADVPRPAPSQPVPREAAE